MLIRTFQEWSDAGFTIIKGSKSQFRNGEGVAMFTEQQVKQYNGWKPFKKAKEEPVVKSPTPPPKKAAPYAGKPAATPPPKISMAEFKDDPLIRQALEEFKRSLEEPVHASVTTRKKSFSSDEVFEDEPTGALGWLD